LNALPQVVNGIASIVPIEFYSTVKGHALFNFDAGEAIDDEPLLEGIFETPDAAKAHMRTKGVVAEV
jgi:hypothetical protein